MTLEWNGIRASVGAVALAVALVVGAPAQAKWYQLTLTGVQEDGSTVTGSGWVDSNPTYSYSSYNDYYGNYSNVDYKMINGS